MLPGKKVVLKIAGFVYYFPKNLDRSELIEYVIENMHQVFLDEQFQKIYRDTSLEGYPSEQKERELDPSNTSTSCFWKKMEDALERPETSTLHSLRFKMQENDAKIVFSQLFGKLNVDDEIEKYRAFYDLGKTKGKNN